MMLMRNLTHNETKELLKKHNPKESKRIIRTFQDACYVSELCYVRNIRKKKSIQCAKRRLTSNYDWEYTGKLLRGEIKPKSRHKAIKFIYTMKSKYGYVRSHTRNKYF